MSIFVQPENPRPYHYPELLDYADAMYESFWIPDHFRYDRDINDFKVNLTPDQQEIIKRCMLAIGVVENKVKTFWARIDMRMPHTEISDVGHCFANSEVIHRRAYEKLLNLLGLDKEFETIMQIPCMEGRTKYLTKYLKGVTSRSDKEFTKSLILFTLLVENCSLFSQFVIVSSFNKYQNVLGNFSSVVNATAREEELHFMFGCHLINIIKKENPEWFDKEYEDKFRRNIRKAFRAEMEVLDWIFERGELPWLPKTAVEEYLKERFNKALVAIGYEQEYEVNEDLLAPAAYFKTLYKTSVSFDFFDSSNTDYSNGAKVSEDDWDF